MMPNLFAPLRPLRRLLTLVFAVLAQAPGAHAAVAIAPYLSTMGGFITQAPAGNPFAVAVGDSVSFGAIFIPDEP